MCKSYGHDLSGNAVCSDEVGFTLKLDSATFRSYIGTTDANGQVSTRGGGAKTGSYKTTFNSGSREGVSMTIPLMTQIPVLSMSERMNSSQLTIHTGQGFLSALLW